MTQDLHAAEVARQFAIEGELISVAPYGSGHINGTYCAVYRQDGGVARFIVQQINPCIFRDPAALMENIRRVTSHLAFKLEGELDRERRVLTLIPSRDGRAWHEDAEGGCWRVYRMIEGARSYDAVESLGQAYQAARAFGRFQLLLADLPAPRLHDTISDFHNTPKRFAAFERALTADVAGRAATAPAEINFALERKGVAKLLLDAQLPERVTHNDTKFNNVLLDDGTGEGICVLDLDTVMPGLAPYDFGDMVRTATCAASEDERDLSKVSMEFEMFEALVRGYLSTAGGFLTEPELEHLVIAGKVITFEQGIRFLADYLAGDTYYKVHREGQNLDRCRTQFKLIESIEAQEEAMQRLVRRLAGQGRG